MFVIGSQIGFVCVFDDLDDLSRVIGQLWGMQEYAIMHDVPAPHVYGVFSSATSQEEAEEFMASLKDGDGTVDLISIQDDDIEE